MTGAISPLINKAFIIFKKEVLNMGRNRIIALVLCMLTTLSLLSACAKTQTPADSGASTPSSSPSAPADSGAVSSDEELIGGHTYKTGLPITKDKVTLKAAMVLQPAHGKPEEMQIFKDMEEKTNIHIDWTTFPSSNATEQKNLLLASGDLPDIFYGTAIINENDVGKYAPEGVFIPLDDLIAEYAPNVTAAFEKSNAFKKACTNPGDNKIYSIGRAAERETQYNQDVLFIYKPWLDQLGLSVPTTTDEFRTVLEAFKTKDPNGNGKADEVPFSFTMGNKQNDLHSLFGAFGRIDFTNVGGTAGHFIVEEDGELVYTANQPEYKAAIEWLHGMFADGLFDQEGLTSKDTKSLVALGNSEEVILGSFIGFDQGNYIPKERTQDYIAIAPLKGPGGDQIWSRSGQNNGNITGNGFVITSSNKYPEASVRWIDQFFEKETSIVTFLGPIGVCLEKRADGVYDYLPTPEGMSYTDFRFTNTPVHAPCAIFADEWGTVVEVMGEDVNKLDILHNIYAQYQTNTIPYIKYTPEEMSYLNSTGKDIDEYVDNRQATWILNGGIDVEWDTYVAKLDQMGLSAYYDVVNGAYQRWIAD